MSRMSVNPIPTKNKRYWNRKYILNKLNELTHSEPADSRIIVRDRRSPQAEPNSTPPRLITQTARTK